MIQHILRRPLALVPLAIALPFAFQSLACSSVEVINPAEITPVDAKDAGTDVEADADTPPDPGPPMLGPSLAFDDFHIATIQEAFHPFALLGPLVNDQLTMSIKNGQLLFGLEIRNLDDPSGQSDPEISAAMIGLSDSDSDNSDNFNPDEPETYSPAPLSFGMDGNPTIEFTTASIKKGFLHAESVGVLMTPGLPFPFANPVLEGTIKATPEEDAIYTLEKGRLTGAVQASLLGFIPNITMGQCQGQTLLDVIATGCGIFPLQPQVDLDGDGLEKFFDDPDDMGVKDFRIDRCVDGDGTEILGTDCVSDSRIADGYNLIFAMHGVRAFVLQPMP